MVYTQDNISQEVTSVVSQIRSAILHSQERSVKAVNQEQLALYYGIGRYISANTRSKNWGKGVIEGISNQLKQELLGLRGFGACQLKNMQSFYEAWSQLDSNSVITIAKTDDKSIIPIGELSKPPFGRIPQLQFYPLYTHPRERKGHRGTSLLHSLLPQLQAYERRYANDNQEAGSVLSSGDSA